MCYLFWFDFDQWVPEVLLHKPVTDSDDRNWHSLNVDILLCRVSTCWRCGRKYGERFVASLLWENCAKLANTWPSGMFCWLPVCLCSVMPATHATETGSSRLVSETCVGQSGTRFWYGIEHSSIPSQKLSGTWHKPCNVIGRSVVFRKMWWFIYLVICDGVEQWWN